MIYKHLCLYKKNIIFKSLWNLLWNLHKKRQKRIIFFIRERTLFYKKKKPKVFSFYCVGKLIPVNLFLSCKRLELSSLLIKGNLHTKINFNASPPRQGGVPTYFLIYVTLTHLRKNLYKKRSETRSVIIAL